MLRTKLAARLLAAVALVAAATAAHAGTLRVNCGGHVGLTSIRAALRVLPPGPTTIQVSGNCRENLLIQSIDRLTLTALNGASISDASGGTLSVVDIEDSRDVAINGFIINAGADGKSGSSGIVCGDKSVCRLSGNTIQGATDGSGFIIFGASSAVLDGDILQGNGSGLGLFTGSFARGIFAARNNTEGLRIVRDSSVNAADCVIDDNTENGVFVRANSTLKVDRCSISGNGGDGVILTQGGFVELSSTTVIGNAAAGVTLADLAFALFADATVSGNQGGTDVICNPQYSATRGVGDTGGTTNCVEP
jgi:hypothetical protein